MEVLRVSPLCWLNIRWNRSSGEWAATALGMHHAMIPVTDEGSPGGWRK
ncbi:MAG: hypothetical protein SF162_13880 [bacterium]|nr:hypothetical protein [bacterium]